MGGESVLIVMYAVIMGGLIINNLRVFFKLCILWKIRRNLGIDLMSGLITPKLKQKTTLSLILADLGILLGNYLWVKTLRTGESAWVDSWVLFNSLSVLIPLVMMVFFKDVQSKKMDIPVIQEYIDSPKEVIDFYWEAYQLVNDTPINILAESDNLTDEGKKELRGMSARLGYGERRLVWDDLPLLNALEIYMERLAPYFSTPERVSGAVTGYTKNHVEFLNTVIYTLKDKDALRAINSESGRDYLMSVMRKFEEVIKGLESTISLLEEPKPINRRRDSKDVSRTNV